MNTAAKQAPVFQISKDLALPGDITGKKLAFLGTTGSGKTYAAQKLAEEMLQAGFQIVVLDPVGVWYGLRIDRDGKKMGLPITIFGGLRGDIPIEATDGALIADLIVDKNISAVVDISQMDSGAEQDRFAIAFAARLFHRRKAQPAATFVFLEEAQEFIPENPVSKLDPMKLHTFTRMAKIGRNFGIGVAPISQRPQELSKKVLNLSECVFAFQMNGKSERDAIKAWLKSTGTEDLDADTLPLLEVGQAHVWSPRWLKVSREVRIAKKRTFDASSTPDFDSSARIDVKPLEAGDLEALRVSMTESIERAEAVDPEKLQAKIVAHERTIAKLEREVAAAVSVPTVDQSAIEATRLEERQACLRILESAMQQIPEVLATAASLFEQPLIGAAADLNLPLEPRQMPSIARRSIMPPPSRPATALVSAPSPTTQTAAATPSEGVSGPEQRILDAIAWANAAGIDPVSNELAAFAARYSPSSTSYTNPRGALKRRDLIDFPSAGTVGLTAMGWGLAQPPGAPATAVELQARVLDRLPGPETRILKVLLENYPHQVTNELCADRAGYSAKSTSYTNPRGALRSLGLIEFPASGYLRAARFLFLEK